jgi:dihydrodipicolinate synthase/N-acetylneuraminate lyase
MVTSDPEIPRRKLQEGLVIPAMPLALDAQRQLDLRHQHALVRYYIDAGAGGLAVGVHTTQFEIRDPRFNLFEAVLEAVSTEIDAWSAKRGRSMLKIAGVCGPTTQAIREADFARRCGYHASLLSLGALRDASLPELLSHCREIASIIPLVGFYLQPAVGGRVLPYDFWRAFAEIDNVVAIKMAPFNRYQTLDVIRAVADAGRAADIALYTGNDDNIVVDLLTSFEIGRPGGNQQCLTPMRIAGGLLGQWAVWTQKAVTLLNEIHRLVQVGSPIPPLMLTLAAQITEANAAVFDAAHQFAGCIPGIHYVLQRQGLLAGTWCLNPGEVLSPGQAEAIQRVCLAYPALQDDDFVRDNLATWLD